MNGSENRQSQRKSMRIFVATLAHETNSFSPVPTDINSFSNGVLFQPKDHPHVDPGTVFIGYSDFVNIAREKGDVVIPGLVAWAQPGAPLARRDYEFLRDEILNGLCDAGKVDAVLLFLHGAQVAHGYDDCEGDVVSRVRELVGPDIPIGVELDLHCNISDTLVEQATIIIACKEYPHTDFDERARELYDLIEDVVQGRRRFEMLLQRVPMLSKFHTTREPMRSFLKRIKSIEDDSIVSVSLAHGFPWSDTIDTGSSVLVVYDPACSDAASVEATLADLAEEFYSYRNDVAGRYESVESIIEKLKGRSEGSGLVVVADTTDNAGGGAAGDSTFLLRAVLDAGLSDVALGMIWDPVAVEFAAAAGTGARLALRIGGKCGPSSGDPVDLNVTVMAVSEHASQRGLETERCEALGKAVCVRAGSIDIVLNSRRQQVFSPDCFTELGIDLDSKSIVILKSSQHFHNYFAPIASEILYCEAPGTLHSRYSRFPFRKLRQPMWPLDADIDFVAAGVQQQG